MAKNLSAIKKNQISLRNNQRNKNYKSTIKTLIKKISLQINTLDSIENKEIGTAISEVYSKIDKAVKKGAISKNSGARKKSIIASKFKMRKRS